MCACYLSSNAGCIYTNTDESEQILAEFQKKLGSGRGVHVPRTCRWKPRRRGQPFRHRMTWGPFSSSKPGKRLKHNRLGGRRAIVLGVGWIRIPSVFTLSPSMLSLWHIAGWGLTTAPPVSCWRGTQAFLHGLSRWLCGRLCWGKTLTHHGVRVIRDSVVRDQRGKVP